MTSLGISNLSELNKSIYNEFMNTGVNWGMGGGKKLKDVVTRLGQLPFNEYVVKEGCYAFGDKIKSLNMYGYIN